MSITIAQIPGALTAIGQITQSCTTITTLLNEAVILNGNNWVVNLANGVSVTLTPAQQLALVALYDNLKASLVTAFNQLP